MKKRECNSLNFLRVKSDCCARISCRPNSGTNLGVVIFFVLSLDFSNPNRRGVTAGTDVADDKHPVFYVISCARFAFRPVRTSGNGVRSIDTTDDAGARAVVNSKNHGSPSGSHDESRSALQPIAHPAPFSDPIVFVRQTARRPAAGAPAYPSSRPGGTRAAKATRFKLFFFFFVFYTTPGIVFNGPGVFERRYASLPHAYGNAFLFDRVWQTHNGRVCTET